MSPSPPSFRLAVASHRTRVLLAVMVAYVLALVPTVIVAVVRPSPRAAGPCEGLISEGGRSAAARDGGTVLMFLASAPTLLAVALAAELHGREAVAPAAIAFTLGSLAAPAFTRRIPEHRTEHLGLWVACAFGMVVGWVLAPVHLALMCVAQVSSGLFMTVPRGLARHLCGASSSRTRDRRPRPGHGRHAPWARPPVQRCCPLLVVGVGLEATTTGISLVLLAALVLTASVARMRPGCRRALPARRSGPVGTPRADAGRVGPDTWAPEIRRWARG